jgi:hypothetical protein
MENEPLITKVITRKIERPKWVPFNIPLRYRPSQIDVLSNNQASMTLWQKITFYSKLSLLAIKLVPLFINIRIAYMKQDWKTTVTGIVKAIFLVLSLLGLNTGSVSEALVCGACYAIIDLVQSFFTADSKPNA